MIWSWVRETLIFSSRTLSLILFIQWRVEKMSTFGDWTSFFFGGGGDEMVEWMSQDQILKLFYLLDYVPLSPNDMAMWNHATRVRGGREASFRSKNASHLILFHHEYWSTNCSFTSFISPTEKEWWMIMKQMHNVNLHFHFFKNNIAT